MMMQLLLMIQHTILYKMAFKYGGDPNGILVTASLRVYAFSFIPLRGDEICAGNDSFANDIWSKGSVVYSAAGGFHYGYCRDISDYR